MAKEFQQKVKITVDGITAEKPKGTKIMLSAPYVNKDTFRFNVYRKAMLSGVRKLLGMQDVIVGHEPFDEDFIIKGSSEAKLKSFFANAKIRDMMESFGEISIEMRDDSVMGVDLTPGVDELYIEVLENSINFDKIKIVYDLALEIITQLDSI